MSIKSRQVAGVTSLVVVIVAALSAYHLATLARLSLQESASRGELLRQAIFQRARDVVPTAKDVASAYLALQKDGGIRSLLESAACCSENVTYAAIVDREGRAVAHSFPAYEGQRLPEQEDLAKIVDEDSIKLLRNVYSDRTFEIRQPLLFGDQEFGSIRIGISTLLVKSQLQRAFKAAAQNVLIALLVSSFVAILLAQWMLRPIHVIQSGLSRLGRGELDVRLELPEGEEFKGLGTSFEAVSAQLSASRAKALPAPTEFETVVENLEDAVALFNPDGDLIFCNPAMGSLLPGFSPAVTRRLSEMAPEDDAVRTLVERTLAAHRPQGPVSVSNDQGEERLLMTHPIDDADDKFVGAMLVARNLAYLNQVHSTLNYSRKLAALGRLMAGVAHEVKNPLNAMTIHLELLRQKLAKAQPVAVGAGSSQADGSGFRLQAEDSLPAKAGSHENAQRLVDNNVTKHVDIIGKEIQRLDQVVGGFLKFARPDELKLQPVHLASVISDVITTVAPEAERLHVTVKTDCPRELPEINADPAMLSQAILNLALNGCQAMPNGGTLKLSCRTTSRKRVEIDVEDTGVGIPPDHLQKIFDLYFTTKEKGSGIGLSMVYRIVQLHDGEVEVQSTPGVGTRFRLMFPQA
jgi:signal transduction histidine kinase